MFEKVSFRNYFKISSVVLALIFSFLLEFYIVLVGNYSDLSVYLDIVPFLEAVFRIISYKWILLFFILFFILFTVLLNPKLKYRVLSFIYNHRFTLAFVAFCVAVVFQLHGSSIAQLDISHSNHRSFLGVSRLIRSDEFNVNTPFALSQYFNNFGYYSDIVRGVPTDMFISYGQPVLDFAVIFRPFHWGYLLLSQGYGLSFFWAGRLIALFVVSFEFGKVITNNNKKLALAYTFLITFSPVVQWWFAINMLVEMLIFGQLAILLTNYYMNTLDYRKRLIISLAFIICAGGFILTMYPAWEIPFGYVFLIAFIWTVTKNRTEFKGNKKDVALFMLFAVILIVSLGYIFLKSQGAITAIMNTVYPGARAYWGGLDVFRTINPTFAYFNSIVSPLVLNSLYIEVASVPFVSFFPLGIILLALLWIVQKKRDFFLIVLLILDIILCIYMAMPLDPIFGSLTFLKSTVEIRLISVIFFINLLILIRSLALIEFNPVKYYKIICLIVAVIISGIGTYISFIPTSQIAIAQMIIAFLIYLVAFYFILLSIFNKKYLKGFLVSVIVISFLAGGLVNPVESGLDYYYNQDIIQETADIVSENPNATWIVVSPIPIDEIIPVGAHTLNSVNIYPNMGLWSTFDSEGEYYDAYNRYAHIPIVLKDEGQTTFNNYQVDVVELGLNINDIKKLNVTYILTTWDLTDHSNENITFVELFRDDNGNMIFEVQ